MEVRNELPLPTLTPECANQPSDTTCQSQFKNQANCAFAAGRTAWKHVTDSKLGIGMDIPEVWDLTYGYANYAGHMVMVVPKCLRSPQLLMVIETANQAPWPVSTGPEIRVGRAKYHSVTLYDYPKGGSIYAAYATGGQVDVYFGAGGGFWHMSLLINEPGQFSSRDVISAPNYPTMMKVIQSIAYDNST